ncbi:hypothetical protein YC2023_050483 [Brassica napus]
MKDSWLHAQNVYTQLVVELHILNAAFTNNVLSTAQQVWLCKLGGATPANKEVAKDTVELLESQSESEEGSDDEYVDNYLLMEHEEEIREGALASSTSKPVPEIGNALYITSRTALPTYTRKRKLVHHTVVSRVFSYLEVEIRIDTRSEWGSIWMVRYEIIVL